MLTYYVLTHYRLNDAAPLLQLIHYLYAFLIFLGGFISWILIYRRLIKWDYDKIKLHIFMFFAGGAGILSILSGSRLARIFYEPRNLWSTGLFFKKFWGGGLFERGTETFHGSLFVFFSCMVFIIFISNRLKFLELKYSEVIDAGAMYMPLHILFGRTGCFLSGCCWGGEGQITIAGETYAFNHPAPFYEMLYGLIMFFILRFIYNKIYLSDKKQVYSGLITAIAAISYGILRFFIEFVRREPVVGFGLTQAQIAMLMQIIFGAGVIVWIALKIHLNRKLIVVKPVKKKHKKKK